MDTFDFIVIGAGSAGSVLANRLTACGRYTVLLLEAGPADNNPFIHMPAGVAALMHSKKYNWRFWTQPQVHLGNRSLFQPRGKTLGGSSSINACVYIRGHASDYDAWAAQGCEGWAYRDVLPYFKRSETYERDDCSRTNLPVDPADVTAFHGDSGPLNIAMPPSRNPLSHAFVQAGRQAGYPHNADFNGASQSGVGLYRAYQKAGQRCSNARAYLWPIRSRPNLTVVTNARAQRILFEGERAVGVAYQEGGQPRQANARREVLLSCGAFNSPQLLMLSGVGPQAELERHGIAVRHVLPGVGHNLQDHLDVFLVMRTRNRLPISLHPLSWLRWLLHLARYVVFRRGELTSNLAEAGGFVRSDPSEPIEDLQLHMVPLTATRHALNLWPLLKTYAYSVMIYDLRPLSRGRITLRSANPAEDPVIDPNYGAHQRDIDRLVKGIRVVRHIVKQAALAPLNRSELAPGERLQSDTELAQWVRATAETAYHPVGTCKMGVDATAVVDPQLKVHGIAGLRVVDCSIMPTIVGGNTNAAATMIAEKAADMILADAAASIADRPETRAT